MEIFFLLGILFLLFLVVSAVIMPWVNSSRIGDLDRQLNEMRKMMLDPNYAEQARQRYQDLQNRLNNLTNQQTTYIPTQQVPQNNQTNVSEENQTISQEHIEPQVQETVQQPVAESQEIYNQVEEDNVQPPEPEQEYVEAESDVNANVQSNAEQIHQPQVSQTKEKVGFEQQFGARMPVWIGGVALALAGFFLVKYSIENNLISPTVRVLLGTIFGIGLLYGAKWVRNKPDFANGIRISQSLAGAGIAVLYVSSFAATRLYDIIPTFAGFIAMAGVTATALVLSLRHGPPIALLGMAGGFLTPALLSTGSGNVFTLFVYLYFTASGLLIVIRKTKWWWMSIPTIIASLLWVLVWLFTRYDGGDSIYLGLFLVAISATIVICSRTQYEVEASEDYKGEFSMSTMLNYIGLGGTMMVMGIIGGKAGFGYFEWGLFGLLAMGGIGLAYFNDRLYGFVPWVSMAVNAVMLYIWTTNYKIDTAITIAVFALIYMLSGYFIMFRSKRPIIWASLACVTSVAYYLISYAKLHNKPLFEDIALLWGGLAFVLAGLSVYALFKIYNKLSDYPQRNYLYSVFTVTATTFTSLALFIELDREFLSVAISVQMLALAWINNRVDIISLRTLTGVVACVFALLLLPQIILLCQLTVYSLVEAKIYLQKTVPIVNWPWFQLGVPALMFMGSAFMLLEQKDGPVVRYFEIAAITLIAVMGYYLTRNALHPDANVLFIKAGFFERGLITNILFVYGLICMVVGRYFERVAISKSGIVLCAAALFRICYFDMFMHNPLWASQKIGGIVIFNSLLLPFGLPLLWSYIARRELKFLSREKWGNYVGCFMLAAIFALITLNVRHIFHGEYLNKGITENAEIYSYSVAWIILGIAMLFGGIIKKDKMLRYASLSIILFTVGKVFLYDASELEGLFRVFSFLGLGVSLIGISYFYTRFVFGDDKAAIQKQE